MSTLYWYETVMVEGSHEEGKYYHLKTILSICECKNLHRILIPRAVLLISSHLPTPNQSRNDDTDGFWQSMINDRI